MSCPLDLTLLCIYSVQIKHSNRKLLLLFLLAKPLSWAVYLVWVILRFEFFFFGAVTLFNVTISCGLLLHCHSLFNGCDFLLNGFVCAPLFRFCLSFEHSIAYHRKFMNSPWLSLFHCTRKWQPFFLRTLSTFTQMDIKCVVIYIGCEKPTKLAHWIACVRELAQRLITLQL